MIDIKTIETTRKKLHISKYEMSKRLNKSTQSYYDIVRRKSTTIETLKKIGVILNLDPKELIL